jgi:hypothetical protein
MPWANDGGSVWNATKCSPIDPDADDVGDPCVVEGSPVSGVDSCVAGAMCFDVDEATLEGECIALCSGTPGNPMCADGMFCAQFNSGDLPLCLAQCDPLAPTCAEGWSCQMALGNLGCLPDGSIACGDTSCPADQACVQTEFVPGCTNGPCCTPWCDVNDPDACTELQNGTTCVPYFARGSAPAGLDHVGLCIVEP